MNIVKPDEFNFTSRYSKKKKKKGEGIAETNQTVQKQWKGKFIKKTAYPYAFLKRRCLGGFAQIVAGIMPVILSCSLGQMWGTSAVPSKLAAGIANPLSLFKFVSAQYQSC